MSLDLGNFYHDVRKVQSGGKYSFMKIMIIFLENNLIIKFYQAAIFVTKEFLSHNQLNIFEII